MSWSDLWEFAVIAAVSLLTVALAVALAVGVLFLTMGVWIVGAASLLGIR